MTTNRALVVPLRPFTAADAHLDQLIASAETLDVDLLRAEEQDALVACALRVLHWRHRPGQVLDGPDSVRDFLRLELAPERNEVFAALYLDTQHRMLAFEHHFYGSIDHTSVHPRVLVQTALKHNAAAMILAHNHPSGVAEPSTADELITQQLVAALRLVDVRVLDHFVVTSAGYVSFAERKLL